MLIRSIRSGVAGLARLAAFRGRLDISARIQWSRFVVVASRDGIWLATITAVIQPASHNASRLPPIPEHGVG